MKSSGFHEIGWISWNTLDFRHETYGSATGMESRVKSIMKSVDLNEILWNAVDFMKSCWFWWNAGRCNEIAMKSTMKSGGFNMKFAFKSIMKTSVKYVMKSAVKSINDIYNEICNKVCSEICNEFNEIL